MNSSLKDYLHSPRVTAKFGLGTSESVGTFICDWLALLERLLIGCFKTKKNPSDQSEQRLRLSLTNENS